jgi:pyruvate/2-oxoglutarate dehydrogenase complex dihydrolipoamide acyltransferase (E2) component
MSRRTCRSDTACTACRWRDHRSPLGPAHRQAKCRIDLAPSGLRAAWPCRQEADVEAAIGRAPARQPASSASAPSASQPPQRLKGMSDDAVLKLFEEGSYELVKHDGMRKTIARA